MMYVVLSERRMQVESGGGGREGYCSSFDNGSRVKPGGETELGGDGRGGIWVREEEEDDDEDARL